MGTPDEKMDSHERSPLIATVRTAPPRRRYSQNTCSRFCTIALVSTLTFAVVLFLLPATLFSQDPHWKPHHPHPYNTESLSFQELQQILLETPSGEGARKWSQYYAAGPHLAGANYSQALWTKEKWEEHGVKSSIVAYETLLNYPLGHRLALYEKKNGSQETIDTWKVRFEASLEEDVLEEDPTTGLSDRIPTFHGYSASGNVTASFVYVNYGTFQDFEDLIQANVSLEGKIGIAKYGKIFRGLKIKRAEELGLVGVLLYSDPGDDGPLTDENGVALYPDGPARNPSSVQRGSTQFLSIAPGDPYVCSSPN